MNRLDPLDTPGNRWPLARHRGYTGNMLYGFPTADQKAAWNEGRLAAGLPIDTRQPCNGKNCGTVIAEHSDECIAEHDKASNMHTVAPEMIDLMADLEIIHEHQDNGPGYFYCAGCDAKADMRWRAGARLDNESDLTHKPHCPRQWARKVKGEAS